MASKNCKLASVYIQQENTDLALASMAQLAGHCPPKQKVAGSIPSQSRCLGCRPIFLWDAHERQLMDVSLT